MCGAMIIILTTVSYSYVRECICLILGVFYDNMCAPSSKACY